MALIKNDVKLVYKKIEEGADVNFEFGRAYGSSSRDSKGRSLRGAFSLALANFLKEVIENTTKDLFELQHIPQTKNKR